MTSMARGSLFWKGTVTNVLKKEKLPVMRRLVSDNPTRVLRQTDPKARAG